MRFSFLFLMMLVLGLHAEAKTFRVGLIYQFDNKFDQTTKGLIEGIEHAKATFEKVHPTMKIEFLRFSHGKDLASVADAANKALEAGAHAVLGGEISEESIVIGDILNPKKVVFLTPTSSSPKVTVDKDYVFTGCFSDRAVAAKLAEFVAKDLKPKRVGIVHNVSSPYSDFLSTEFLRRLKEIDPNRGSRALVAKVVRSTYDFEKIVTLFKNENVSHVVLLSHDSDLLRFQAQAIPKDYFPAYVGSDGWGSNDYVYRTFANSTAEGHHFVGYRNGYWDSSSPSKAAVKFKSDFKKRYGHEPNDWNAIAYDAANVLFESALKSSETFSELRLSLRRSNLKDLVTTDAFKFDEWNSPKRPLIIHKIDKSGIKLEKVLK